MGGGLSAFDALPEWEQEARIARWHQHADRCPQCHGPREECSDAERVLYPQRTICHVTRERLAAQRRYDELHKTLQYHDGTEASWAKEPSIEHPYRYDDGVHVWVSDRDVNPDDQFLTHVSQRVADEEGDEAGQDQQA